MTSVKPVPTFPHPALAEIGDLARFESPRQLMAYLGLVPSERSTGESVKRGGITKAGNGRARRVLVEAAWAYRHPPRVGVEKQVLVAAAPRSEREIAWKAQVRLRKRFRTLSRKGKKSTVVATAIARELAAFIWAIAREVNAMPARAGFDVQVRAGLSQSIIREGIGPGDRTG